VSRFWCFLGIVPRFLLFGGILVVRVFRWTCGLVGLLWACVVVAPPGYSWRFCSPAASWLLVSPASSWGLLPFLLLSGTSWLFLVGRAIILMTLIFLFCRKDLNNLFFDI